MVVKTFRGQLDDRAQQRLRLSTIKGKTGYRIVKFLVMPAGATSGFAYESFIEIWKTEQSAVPSDATFNQDIYITHSNSAGSAAINYYFELEIIPLDDKGAEYTTVKDLRTRGF